MTAGGCSDNAVARAEILRRQYRQQWREVQAIPTVVPTRRRVENVLLRVVDETTDVVRQGGEPWGRSLWREVQVRLDDLTDAGHGYGPDVDLLLVRE